MTASPTVGSLTDVPPAVVPEGPAAPSADEVPPITEEVPPEEEKKRRRRAFFLLFLLGLLAFLIGLIIWYLLFRQPLPIIPPIPEAQIPSYSMSIYGSDRPVGVTVTPSGDRIYVSESGGDKVVRIFDGGGTEIGTMVPPAETGASHVPVYLAIDPLTEEVYVTDRPTGSIYIYDRDGRYQRQFTPVESQGNWQPLGITFAPDGTLYVTNLTGPNPHVIAFDRTGNVIARYGEAEQLSFPNGVALDSTGNIYVTDSNNGRLLVFAPEGEVIAKVGRGADAGKLGLPRGVAIDGAGRLFIVDTTGQGAHVFRSFKEGDRRLEFYGGFGTQGAGEGQFSYPNGVAVDGRSRLYVADTGNDRIQVWGY